MITIRTLQHYLYLCKKLQNIFYFSDARMKYIEEITIIITVAKCFKDSCITKILNNIFFFTLKWDFSYINPFYKVARPSLT